MAVTGLDHIYAETHDWEASVAFWEGLGFAFVERWGSEGHRAGKLETGTAAVVLAEVQPDRTAEFNVFFAVDRGLVDASPAVAVVTPWEDTHWGTRWLRARDPEGRVHCFEEGTA